MRFLKLILVVTLFTTSLLSKDKIGKSFMGLNTGYIYSDVSTEGSVDSKLKLESEAPSYGFEMGYKTNKNIFYTLNYSKYYFDSRSFDNYYFSANYLFDLGKKKFSLYMGALAGWSSVLWRVESNTLSSSKNRSDNYLLGGQVGFEYTIKKDLFLYYSYIYSYSPQEMLFEENAKTQYDNQHNVIIGFRYYPSDI